MGYPDINKKIPIRVNMNEQPVLICSACKNRYFRPIVKIRSISPVLFGSSTKTYAMEQFFECTKCQAVISYANKKEFGFELVSEPVKKAAAADSFELEE